MRLLISQYLKGGLICLLLVSSPGFSHQNSILDHRTQVEIDQNLTLFELISLTLSHYPDQQRVKALTQEVDALTQRGDSWLVKSAQFGSRYQSDQLANDIGLREANIQLTLPIWNWGQRTAAQQVAQQAAVSAKAQAAQIHLAVAGLVRQALWDMALRQVRYQQAQAVLATSKQLRHQVKLSVDLGNLPQTDFLLAETDFLQKKSQLVQAKAEWMYSLESYINLTQTQYIPADFTEQRSPLIQITEQHPQLVAINALIKRKRLELTWIKKTGSGQSRLKLVGKTERGQRGQDNIESLSVGISIPWGGQPRLAPKIAQANLALTDALIKKSQLLRALEKQRHQAQYKLQATQSELEISRQLQQIAQTQLKKAGISFSAGDINLMDLLKIQAQANYATRRLKENLLSVKQAIAMYNQAVGIIRP